MNRRCRVAASIALATVELGAGASCSPGPAPATIAHHGATGDPCPTADAAAGAGFCLAAATASSGASGADGTSSPRPAGPDSAPTSPSSGEIVPTPDPEPAVKTTAPVVNTTAPTTAPRRTTTTVYEPPSPQSRTTGRGDEPPGNDAPLACIRSYEGDYTTNTGNGYYGAYQFDLPTWRSVGGTGLPSDASPAEQDMRAQMLYDRRGLAPWPTPAVMCR